jgi:hypothetical protein
VPAAVEPDPLAAGEVRADDELVVRVTGEGAAGEVEPRDLEPGEGAAPAPGRARLGPDGIGAGRIGAGGIGAGGIGAGEIGGDRVQRAPPLRPRP